MKIINNFGKTILNITNKSVKEIAIGIDENNVPIIKVVLLDGTYIPVDTDETLIP